MIAFKNLYMKDGIFPTNFAKVKLHREGRTHWVCLLTIVLSIPIDVLNLKTLLFTLKANMTNVSFLTNKFRKNKSVGGSFCLFFVAWFCLLRTLK